MGAGGKLVEDPKVIFYSAKYLPVVTKIRNSGGQRKFIALDGSFSEGRVFYEDLMKQETGPVQPVDLQPDDTQLLIHTGGTTGTPKAAMLTYSGLFHNMVSEIITLQLNHNDCAYVWLPLFHTAAWNVLTMPLLLAGGRIILTSEFSPGTSLKIIREERPTVGISVETIYKAMAAHPDFLKTDFACYRWLINGAAPISRETLELYWARGVKLVNGYGMTEIGASNLIPPINEVTIPELRRKWDAAGKPLFFNQVRVVDESLRDVPIGERGELIWKGNLTFSGYWNAPQASREMFTPDGWVRSGDIGYCDEEGYYYICGRLKNMFISGGENIFPLEIETVIAGHPDVQECCVIGVPDGRWGEVGKALVVLRPGCAMEAKAVKKLAAAELSSIKIPKYVAFVPEIPRNAMGKRDLAAIMERFGAPEGDG